MDFVCLYSSRPSKMKEQTIFCHYNARLLGRWVRSFEESAKRLLWLREKSYAFVWSTSLREGVQIVELRLVLIARGFCRSSEKYSGTSSTATESEQGLYCVSAEFFLVMSWELRRTIWAALSSSKTRATREKNFGGKTESAAMLLTKRYGEGRGPAFVQKVECALPLDRVQKASRYVCLHWTTACFAKQGSEEKTRKILYGRERTVLLHFLTM